MSDAAPVRLDDQVCFSLYSTGLAMNKLYRRLLAPLGITYPQYLVLLVLWEQGTLSVSQIGDRLFLDSATLTPLLKRLEASGLVERNRDRGDERLVNISLTDQGKHLQDQARGIPAAVYCASGGGELKEVIALKSQLETLRGRLQEGA